MVALDAAGEAESVAERVADTSRGVYPGRGTAPKRGIPLNWPGLSRGMVLLVVLLVVSGNYGICAARMWRGIVEWHGPSCSWGVMQTRWTRSRLSTRCQVNAAELEGCGVMWRKWRTGAKIGGTMGYSQAIYCCTCVIRPSTAKCNTTESSGVENQEEMLFIRVSGPSPEV